MAIRVSRTANPCEMLAMRIDSLLWIVSFFLIYCERNVITCFYALFSYYIRRCVRAGSYCAKHYQAQYMSFSPPRSEKTRKKTSSYSRCSWNLVHELHIYLMLLSSTWSFKKQISLTRPQWWLWKAENKCRPCFFRDESINQTGFRACQDWESQTQARDDWIWYDERCARAKKNDIWKNISHPSSITTCALNYCQNQKRSELHCSWQDFWEDRKLRLCEVWGKSPSRYIVSLKQLHSRSYEMKSIANIFP